MSIKENPPDQLAEINPLISPSKARHDAQVANQWAQVHTWLQSLFHPSPVPKFEQNDTTLAYLLTLRQANERADHQKSLLHAATVEALELHQQDQLPSDSILQSGSNPQLSNPPPQPRSPTQRLLIKVFNSLTPAAQTALHQLATVSVLLGVSFPATTITDKNSNEPSPLLSTLSHHLQNLITLSQLSNVRKNRLDLLSHHLNLLTKCLQNQTPTLATKTDSTQPSASSPEDTFSISDQLPAQTAQLVQDTKQLTMKSAEYRDRLAQLSQWRTDGPTVEDVALRRRMLGERLREVRTLEERVAGYSGLPPDIEASRAEVQRAQRELEALKHERERLFSKLLER